MYVAVIIKFCKDQICRNILTWQLVVSPSAVGTMPLAVTKHFGCVAITQAAAESHLHTPSVTSHLLVAPLVAVATLGRHDPALHYKFEINAEDVIGNNIQIQFIFTLITV